MIRPLTAVGVAAAMAWSGAARAQDPAAGPTRAEFDELKRKFEEVAKKQEEASAHRVPHFHGYGDLHYNRPRLGTMDADAPARVDFHRLVIGLDHELAEGVGFSMEIDFEHALAAADLELEFAYLQFDLMPEMSVRAGAVLMPVGPLNEFHEPIYYYSVERPYTQRSLIPTTWQEVGVGLVGRAFDGRLAYRAYVVNGLDATKFNAADGLRGGRGKGGREAPAEDLAGVVRLEFPVAPELMLGTSLYGGGADQETSGVSDPMVGLVEADALVNAGDFEFRGVLVHTRISQADDINAKIAAASRPVGETLHGGYVEAAHHLLRALKPDAAQDVVLFVRYESVDTNKEVPRGFAKDPAQERSIGSFGAAWYPLKSVAVKADYERWRDGTGDRLSRWNLGLGFVY